MDRSIGQPKFAGKTHMKFERQESKKTLRLGITGRQESKLFHKVWLMDMHSVPLLHLLYADKIVLKHALIFQVVD